MVRVQRKKQIIDRKILVGELEGLVGWSGYTSKIQGQILEFFKSHMMFTLSNLDMSWIRVE